MTPLVPLALLGFIPFVLAVFALMPARRAVIVSVIAGWLFLPMASYPLPGFPDYNKLTATSVAVFLAAIVFDSRRVLSWRPRWFDVPMGVWCVVSFGSSVANDLGAYDGFATAFGQIIRWGLPYLLGRVYFSDPEGMRELAVGIFVGGLLYMPLCWIEIRLSPQLHRWVYGFHQHQFAQTKRFGGFRPVVFLQHGLAVGMWMTAASLTGVWLAWTGGLKRLSGVPVTWLLGVLLPTTVLVKSFGALALLALGLSLLAFCRWTNTRFALMVLVAMPILYVGTRGTGMWDGQELVDISTAVAGEERADSLAYRIRNENVLVAHALRRPVFGWGGWGRHMAADTDSRVVTDGLWVVALAQNGLVGLTSVFVAHLLPVVMFLTRRRVAWPPMFLAGAEAMSVLLSLHVIDFLFNGMINPVFTMAAGGLPALAAGLGARRPPVPAYAGRVPHPQQYRTVRSAT